MFDVVKLRQKQMGKKEMKWEVVETHVIGIIGNNCLKEFFWFGGLIY